MKDKIYEMKLFEEIIIKETIYGFQKLKRVPGGWVLIMNIDGTVSTTFIPFNNEFQKPKELDITWEFK